ncbi:MULTISPECIES: nitrite reductase small subunit NirD [Corallincola]|uniref:Nitrite reductase (NAD(P)H) small subunit n=3 Tax=Corallincola TaxID=1775176 RepID=A0A368NQN0_9GAMM|nr:MULTISPECIES: nitrite reductase small subunit NirD [Corallincola]RCU52708.1 nitrite reductase (NAD(P)H) small subunit [Corallincola holothuriorum]TAA48111.1 nitrite reductase small subunit NirD [Corallincola spongiicola]TCI03207.1 nitrite reductase small subunit NirD [Corallincola luteus]
MSNETWIDICDAGDIHAGVGVCALHQGEQVAIFRSGCGQQLFAIGNYDPFGKANVLSRGITGSLQGEPVVASPLYKQHFSLRDGSCIEDASVAIPTYPVRELEGRVQLQSL